MKREEGSRPLALHLASQRWQNKVDNSGVSASIPNVVTSQHPCPGPQSMRPLCPEDLQVKKSEDGPRSGKLKSTSPFFVSQILIIRSMRFWFAYAAKCSPGSSCRAPSSVEIRVVKYMKKQSVPNSSPRYEVGVFEMANESHLVMSSRAGLNFSNILDRSCRRSGVFPS